MFARTPQYATTHPRINLNNTESIATTNGSQLAMGTYVRQSGAVVALINNTSTATTVFSLSTNDAKAWSINYTITRDEGYRTGIIVITAAGSASLTYTDDWTENLDSGIALSVTQSGTAVNIKYTSTNTGFNAELTYSITHLG